MSSLLVSSMCSYVAFVWTLRAFKAELRTNIHVSAALPCGRWWYWSDSQPYAGLPDGSRPDKSEYKSGKFLTAFISEMTPNLAHLLPPSWKSQVSVWLTEDTPSFDYGGYVVGEAPREAFLLGKGSKRAVLAGTPFVDEIFRLLDCTYVHHCSRSYFGSQRNLLPPQSRVAHSGG